MMTTDSVTVKPAFVLKTEKWFLKKLFQFVVFGKLTFPVFNFHSFSKIHSAGVEGRSVQWLLSIRFREKSKTNINASVRFIFSSNWREIFTTVQFQWWNASVPLQISNDSKARFCSLMSHTTNNIRKDRLQSCLSPSTQILLLKDIQPLYVFSRLTFP